MRRYDIPTAITFLFAGVGLGAVLAILFAPRSERRNSVGERLEGEAIFDGESRPTERDEEELFSSAV